MDRRTRKHLAQLLQQHEQLGVDATTQPSPLVDRVQPYIEVLDRLKSVRRVDPAPGLMAAGRERLLSALSAAPRGSRGFSSLFFTPVLRSAAVVLALVALTGAAAGTSWALGGPNIWPGKADRDSDRAIERSENSQPNIDPADGDSSSDTGSGTVDDGSGGAEQDSSGDDDNGQAGPISDDQPDDDMMVGEEPEGTDEPEDEAEPEPADPTEGADDEDDAEDDDSDKQSADIETDVAPSPLQYRLQMAYDDNAPATTDGDRSEDSGAGDSGSDNLNNTADETSAAEGPSRPVAAQSPPGQAIANDGGRGPGQNGQQHSGR